MDIKSAFRLLPINPGEFDLLGFKFDDFIFAGNDFDTYSKLMEMFKQVAQ